jgi:hypothetical protein
VISRVEHERVELPEQQEPEAVVEVTVAQKDSTNRRVAPVARMQPRKSLDVAVNVRGRIEQEPVVTVRGDGDRLLRPRKGPDRALAQTATIRATTVPLRKSAACR